jgi:uncharacterized protein YbaA (DUF1428 family)
MTYFEGFIVPVPEANRDAYKKHASEFAPLIQEIGVRRMVESWDSDVPEGKIMSDESLKPEGEMPFDGKRMFWGGFEKIVDTAEARAPFNA